MSLIGGGCPMTYVGGSCVSTAFSPAVSLSKNYLSSSPVTTASTSSYYGSVSTPSSFSYHGSGSMTARRFSGESVPSNGTPCEAVKPYSSSSDGADDNGLLPVPTVHLFQPEKIRMQWDRTIAFHHPIGLINAGNSCFLNSVLQCLTFTAPLTNYFLHNGHTRDRMCPEFCIMCRLQRHVQLCFTGKFNYFRPNAILDNLPAIARHMERFRQEDAHDFLRCLTDTMQKRLLFGHNKLDRYSRETTLLNHIFGGYLRSQVVCSSCKAVSNTYEPFLDLSLEVKDVSTLMAALQLYCSNEVLDNDNAYSCGRCKLKVRAHKRFTIHRPSRVLTIQLKRYAAGGANMKLNRHTEFPLTIDIGPYLSAETNDTHLCYDLYGVLVHYGMTTTSGHYYCCVLAPNNRWYKLNDATVTQISRDEVLRQEAYMLFYIRSSTNRPAANVSINVPTTSVGPYRSSGPRPMTPGQESIISGSTTVVAPAPSATPRIVPTGMRPTLPVHSNGVRPVTPVQLPNTPAAAAGAGISQSNGLKGTTGVTKPSITVIKHSPATTVTTATTSKLVTTTTTSSVMSAFTPAAAPLKPVASRQKVSFSVQWHSKTPSKLTAFNTTINTTTVNTTVSSTVTRLPAAPLVPYDDEEESDTEKDTGVVEKKESEVLHEMSPGELSDKLVDRMVGEMVDLPANATNTTMVEPSQSVVKEATGLVDGKDASIPLPQDFFPIPLPENPPLDNKKPPGTEHVEDTPPSVKHVEDTPPSVKHVEDTPPSVKHVEDTPVVTQLELRVDEVSDKTSHKQEADVTLSRKRKHEEGASDVDEVVDDKLKRHKRSHHKHRHHHRHRSQSSRHSTSWSKHNGKMENDPSEEEEVDYIWVEKTKDVVVDGASRSVSDCTLPLHRRLSTQAAAVSKSWHSPSRRHRHHRDQSHHRDPSHHRDQSHHRDPRTIDVDDCQHEHKCRSSNRDVRPARYDSYRAGDNTGCVTSGDRSRSHHR